MSKTLLLADDSVTIQKVVGISFASEDISITTVDNGDDAIARARELRPDVVLADVVMPGKNGYEVCEAIKADPSLAHVPVLLLTGTFEAFDEERAAQAGAAGHVAKPFEAQTLVDRVKDLLAQAPPPAPVQPPAPAAPAAAPTAQGVAPTAPSGDGAFDFFEENLGELSGPAPATAAVDPAGQSLDLDGPDVAFAFGDDDLSSVTQEPASAPPLAASPEPNPVASPETTPETAGPAIAMAPASDATRVPDPAQTTVDTSFMDDTAPESAAGEAPAASEGFDFEFETIPPATSGSPAGPVGVDDLAQATILDPSTGDGFAVSSSDLAMEPEPPTSPPSQSLDGPISPAEAALDPDTPPSGPDLTQDPVMDLLAPDPVPEPSAAPSQPVEMPSTPAMAEPEAPLAAEATFQMGTPSPYAEPIPDSIADSVPEPLQDSIPDSTFDLPNEAAQIPGRWDDDAASEPSEPRAQAPEPVETGLAAADLEPITDLGEVTGDAPELETDPFDSQAPLETIETASSSEPIDDLEPLEDPEPAPRELPPESTPAIPALDPEALHERIAPALQATLHDTLEKMAWDAFDPVTQKIVELAVERIERVAWEVVPKLAETLIQEEIRKLKGSGSD